MSVLFAGKEVLEEMEANKSSNRLRMFIQIHRFMNIAGVIKLIRRFRLLDSTICTISKIADYRNSISGKMEK